MDRPEPTVQARYIGSYGSRHTKALVFGVGEVIRGEIREIPTSLLGDEWETVEDTCRMVDASGRRCRNERMLDSNYCEPCSVEIKTRVVEQDKTSLKTEV
jgi:hypothetical protein